MLGAAGYGLAPVGEQDGGRISDSCQEQSQASGGAAWQAVRGKAPWESWDMLMGVSSFRKGRQKKAAHEKKTSWVRLCHFVSVSSWEGALCAFCPIHCFAPFVRHYHLLGKARCEYGLLLF